MHSLLIRRSNWTFLTACILTFCAGQTAIAQDCNGNGVPDGDDLTSGFSVDCNTNGVPDECDIDVGTSLDCQSNGVPDECELTAVNGLAGAYYDELDFQGSVKGRIDSTVDFQGGGAWPGLGLATDTFTVRWTGYVLTPSASGEYEFFTRTDDGARLWVNGIQLVDKWVTQGTTEWSGTLDLEADSQYWIVMEYFEQGGGETAELRWQPPGFSKEIIPAANLIPGYDCNTNGIPDDCDIAAGTSDDLYLNGVPDECETLDCNGNGTPDDQDISGGTSQDCNTNDVPDECEIDWGWSSDCDENGTLDECEGLTGAVVLYVDSAATGLADGSSWTDAFTELRTAMCVASFYLVVQEIRVAGGIYTPAPAGGELSATFRLRDGLAIYGGYAGAANPVDPNERNIVVYETTLSGDLNGDDDGWDIRQRTQWRRDPKRAPRGALFLGEVGFVQRTLGRRLPPKRPWHGQVDLAGQHIAQLVQAEGGLMRDNRLRHVVAATTPQRQPNQVVVFADRDRRNAVKAASNTLEIAATHVIRQVRVVVPRLFGLLSREVSALGGGDCCQRP